jgi:hypothetical protein
VKNQLAKNMNLKTCQGIKGRTEGWLGVRLGYFIDAHRGEGETERAKTSRTTLPSIFKYCTSMG